MFTLSFMVYQRAACRPVAFATMACPVGAAFAAADAVAGAVAAVAVAFGPAGLGYVAGWGYCPRLVAAAAYPAVGAAAEVDVVVAAYPVTGVVAAAAAVVAVAVGLVALGYCVAGCCFLHRHLAVVACPAAGGPAVAVACRCLRHSSGPAPAGRACACCLFPRSSGLFGQPHPQNHGRLPPICRL